MLLSVEGSFSCCIRLQCDRRSVSSRTWRVQLSHLPQRARRFASPLAPGVAGWTLRKKEGGGQDWPRMQEMMRGSLGDGGGAPFKRQRVEVFETEVEGDRRWDVRHAVEFCAVLLVPVRRGYNQARRRVVVGRSRAVSGDDVWHGGPVCGFPPKGDVRSCRVGVNRAQSQPRHTPNPRFVVVPWHPLRVTEKLIL